MGLVRIRQDFVESLRVGRRRLRARRRCVGKRYRSAGNGRSTFPYDLNYEKAAKYYERLLHLHPSMWDNFVICGQYATCLKKIARAQEAAQIIATALDRSRLAAERAKGEGLELIKREEALLLLQAGRADKSFPTLRSMQTIAAPTPR